MVVVMFGLLIHMHCDICEYNVWVALFRLYPVTGAIAMLVWPTGHVDEEDDFRLVGAQSCNVLTSSNADMYVAIASSVPSKDVSVPVGFRHVDKVVTRPRRHLAMVSSSLVGPRRMVEIMWRWPFSQSTLGQDVNIGNITYACWMMLFWYINLASLWEQDQCCVYDLRLLVSGGVEENMIRRCREEYD